MKTPNPIEEKMKEVAIIIKTWLFAVKRGDKGYQEAHDRIENLFRTTLTEARASVLSEIELKMPRESKVKNPDDLTSEELNEVENYHRGFNTCRSQLLSLLEDMKK